jgi:hypothetical protein
VAPNLVLVVLMMVRLLRAGRQQWTRVRLVYSPKYPRHFGYFSVKRGEVKNVTPNDEQAFKFKCTLLDLSALAFRFSSNRQLYVSLLFNSRFIIS